MQRRQRRKRTAERSARVPHRVPAALPLQLRRPLLPKRDLTIGIAIAIVSVAISAWLAHRGLFAISDDDFSRAVIAQRFVEHPALDPSGTSWLPLPFWLTGALMKLTAPSFSVARAVMAGFSALSSAALYLALRKADIAMREAFLGVTLTLLNPWHAYTSAAAVPEAMTANLVAIAFVGMLAARGPTLVHAAALALATLSRYEPWTMALAFAPISFGLAHVRGVRGVHAHKRSISIAAVALLGVILWTLWNQYSHGDALHFYRRVSNFKAAHEQVYGTTLLQWLRTHGPELATLCPIVLFLGWRTPSVGLCILFSSLALMVAEWKGGAPTHHGERVWLAAMTTGLAVLPAAFVGLHVRLLGLGGVLLFVFVVRLAQPLHFDGSRAALVDMGASLREREHITLQPCAYEHFAVMAGYERPSRVTVLPALPQKDAALCPKVVPASRE